MNRNQTFSYLRSIIKKKMNSVSANFEINYREALIIIDYQQNEYCDCVIGAELFELPDILISIINEILGVERPSLRFMSDLGEDDIGMFEINWNLGEKKTPFNKLIERIITGNEKFSNFDFYGNDWFVFEIDRANLEKSKRTPKIYGEVVESLNPSYVESLVENEMFNLIMKYMVELSILADLFPPTFLMKSVTMYEMAYCINMSRRFGIELGDIGEDEGLGFITEDFLERLNLYMESEGEKVLIKKPPHLKLLEEINS